MKRILFSIYCCAATACLAGAQSFDALIRQVVENNPEIISANASAESELLTLRSENNLADPEIGFEHMWAPSGVENKWNASISQSFDWPGVYQARSKAYRSASSAMDYLRQSRYIDKSLEVKLLFIDIINTRKSLALCDTNLELFSNLLSHYQKGYEQGEFTRLDINKIRVEQLSLTRRRASLDSQLEVLKGSLTALNGGNDCSDILALLSEYPDEPLLSIADYEQLLATHDPQLNYQSSLIESQQHLAKAAQLSRYPSFSIGYAHAREEGHSFNGISLSVTLPFFSSRHKAKAAEIMQQSYIADLNGVKVDRSAIMFADHAIATSLFREIADYRTILDDGYLSLLRKALDGGEMTLISYIQEVNFYQEAVADMLEVEYQYHLTLARLNRYATIP